MATRTYKRALSSAQAANCENARHPRCRCRCGGRLHGRGHAAYQVQERAILDQNKEITADQVDNLISVLTTQQAELPAPFPQRNRIYPSLDAFYADNPDRQMSGESDYGTHWTNPGQSYPLWRVSYIQKTGEVYAVQLGGAGVVQVLGTLAPDQDDIYYRTLNHVLDGWAEVCGQPGSLDWVRRRLPLEVA